MLPLVKTIYLYLWTWISNSNHHPIIVKGTKENNIHIKIQKLSFVEDTNSRGVLKKKKKIVNNFLFMKARLAKNVADYTKPFLLHQEVSLSFHIPFKRLYTNTESFHAFLWAFLMLPFLAPKSIILLSHCLSIPFPYI